MKRNLIAAMSVVAVLGLVASVQAEEVTYEISFTNVTHGIILTPPIFSLSRHKLIVSEVGEPASLGLQMVAEGGATGELRAELESQGIQDVIQMQMPVMPGATVTTELSGNKRSRLNMASMLLPTNDGFVVMNGARVFSRRGQKVFYLKAFDAGSELNDEICANIPGPQCGGEGFNPEDGEGYVVPHAGLHGESELSRQTYNWGEPVAILKVRVVEHDDDDSDSDSDSDG